MKMYSYTSNDLSGLLNDGIDAYLKKLRESDIISQEEFDKLVPYRLVAADSTFFGRIWNKIAGRNDEGAIYYTVVKVIGQ